MQIKKVIYFDTPITDELALKDFFRVIKKRLDFYQSAADTNFKGGVFSCLVALPNMHFFGDLNHRICDIYARCTFTKNFCSRNRPASNMRS